MADEARGAMPRGDQGATHTILHARHAIIAKEWSRRRRRSRKLLLPILDGEADAALKGRACYALGYRHESCGGSEAEAEAWLAKAAAFGDLQAIDLCRQETRIASEKDCWTCLVFLSRSARASPSGRSEI